MKKILLLFILIFPIVYISGQSLDRLTIEELSERIDSLNESRKKSSLSDLELIKNIKEIRQLKSLIYTAKNKNNKHLNLDSLDNVINTIVDELWEYSLKEDNSIVKRDSVYSLIIDYRSGLDILIENIDIYIFEPNEGQFEESLNYPVFQFLIKNPSLIYFDYISKKLCDESYQDKFEMLLLAAINSSKSDKLIAYFLDYYLNNDCISQNQISIIKSHINSMK